MWYVKGREREREKERERERDGAKRVGLERWVDEFGYSFCALVVADDQRY